MGTYDNLDKKSKNIVDTGVLLGILSDLGSGLTFIMDDKGTKLFPKIVLNTRGGAKLIHITRQDGFEFVFNLILMASARNTVGIKDDMYGLVSLSTYAPNNGKPQFVSSRTLAHYYLQEGLDHNQVPLKHTIDTLSKLNVAPDQPLELLTSMLPSFVKAVGMGPDVLKNNRNYLSKIYLLQDEFLGLGIMKRK